MSDRHTAAFPIARPQSRLTDLEVQRLSLWAQRSTMPSWRSFDPSMPSTPPETIARLIGEWHAMRAILDLVGEFAGDLRQVLARLEEGGQ